MGPDQPFAADFTVLGDDPRSVTPKRLNPIHVRGTVDEGRWFPAADQSGNLGGGVQGASGPRKLAQPSWK
ncbi:MAG: hypothetical protein JWR11_3987 [Mycobacterium sp.]|jgi:hypothetical protein|nr:hypothetical protein [Mycobacterium sp.]MDT5181004.1 hypothetical protein [Mycobacterium sp.]